MEKFDHKRADHQGEPDHHAGVEIGSWRLQGAVKAGMHEDHVLPGELDQIDEQADQDAEIDDPDRLAGGRRQIVDKQADDEMPLVLQGEKKKKNAQPEKEQLRHFVEHELTRAQREVAALMVRPDMAPAAVHLAEALGLGKANTSNHLSCLRGCGLVVAEPEGRRVRYELADERLAVALRALADVVLSIDPDCSHTS